MKNCPHFPKIIPYIFKYGHVKPSIASGWLCLRVNIIFILRMVVYAMINKNNLHYNPQVNIL